MTPEDLQDIDDELEDDGSLGEDSARRLRAEVARLQEVARVYNRELREAMGGQAALATTLVDLAAALRLQVEDPKLAEALRRVRQVAENRARTSRPGRRFADAFDRQRQLLEEALAALAGEGPPEPESLEGRLAAELERQLAPDPQVLASLGRHRLPEDDELEAERISV